MVPAGLIVRSGRVRGSWPAGSLNQERLERAKVQPVPKPSYQNDVLHAVASGRFPAPETLSGVNLCLVQQNSLRPVGCVFQVPFRYQNSKRWVVSR